MLARKEILPSGWDDFNKFFVDMENKRVKNKSKFQNRIVGLTSYYGDFFFSSVEPSQMLQMTIKKQDFPDKLPPNIVRVPMSEYQFIQYSMARDMEMQEASFGSTSGAAMQKPKGIFTSSYRRLSRQFSNIAFPNHAMRIDGRHVTLMSDKVDSDDLLNLLEYSPKWMAMLKNLVFSGKHLVYSSFVENAGIDMFAKVLCLHGWKEVTLTIHKQYNTDNTDDPIIGAGMGGVKYQFIRITGNIAPEDRQPLLDMFNKQSNSIGNEIKCILISGAGAEGLDLKSVMHIHIMEPYWNWIRLEQVIGRGARYKSHIQLPKKDQKVNTYIYVSDYPSNINKNNPLLAESTTDVTLLETSQTMHKINHQFYIAMAEAAVDCGVHNKNKFLHCRLCTPTGESLYIDDLHKDMTVRSPCKSMEKRKYYGKRNTCR